MAQPTPELQDAIESTHAAIAAEQDPKHKAVLGQCLTQMMKIQAEHMASPDGSGNQQPLQDQSAQPPGGPADQGGQGGQGAVDPRALLMAQLGGGG